MPACGAPLSHGSSLRGRQGRRLPGRSTSVVAHSGHCPPATRSAGEYRDRLIKQDGGGVSRRRLRSDRLVSDPSIGGKRRHDADVAAVVGHLLAATRRLGDSDERHVGRLRPTSVYGHTRSRVAVQDLPNPIIGRRHAERKIWPPLRKRRCDRPATICPAPRTSVTRLAETAGN